MRPAFIGFNTVGTVALSPAGMGPKPWPAAKPDYMVFWYLNALFDPDQLSW
jgi:hypothetical protein